jgi:hypothetical protein
VSLCTASIIMKTAAVLALLPIASAFVAPMPKGASRGRSLKMAFENEAGVTAPLGYWVSLAEVAAMSFPSTAGSGWSAAHVPVCAPFCVSVCLSVGPPGPVC